MPIRLITTKVVAEKDKTFLLINIATDKDACESDTPDGINLWIRTTCGLSHGEHFVRNQSGTIAALNIRPATKWEMVYLLLSFHSDSLTILSDFNEQVTRLCTKAGKDINDHEIVVEKIEGNVLILWSRAYAEAIYHLKIHVSESGRLRLLNYKMESLKQK